MNKISTGGPAFPIKDPAMTIDEQGMTLRDYFAAKAMSAIYHDRSRIFGNGDWPLGYEVDIALEAYDIANAMLEARKP